MPSLPIMDKNVCHSPHVVLLGAGASRAAFLNGDANGKQLPLMNDFIEIVGLSEILDKEGILYESANFEEIYDELTTNKKYQTIIQQIEKIVYEYFADMKILDEPTIYDYLILSLRQKDIIASFNWDPLLLQAYRRNIHIGKLPELFFLHGNVGMGVCYEDKRFGYVDTICEKCKESLSPVKLLYPVKHKNYSSDSLIKEQWGQLRYKLKMAYMFTIFGYSAPVTDIDAKNLMLDVWKNNPTLQLSEIEIIDVKSREELEKTWNEFTYSHHYGIHDDFFYSWLCRHPRRSCDAFFAATMMCKPWKDNKFPRFKTIHDLHNWVKPLLEEEMKYDESKKPFKYMVE